MKDFYITSMHQVEIYFDLGYEETDAVFDYATSIEKEAQIESEFQNAGPCSYPCITARCQDRAALRKYALALMLRIKQLGGKINP